MYCLSHRVHFSIICLTLFVDLPTNYYLTTYTAGQSG